MYYLCAIANGYNIEGVLYDVARKPALRRGKSETASAFTVRCCDELRGDPDKYFGRDVVHRSAAELEVTKANLLGMHKLIQVGVYPQATRSCTNYNRECEYYQSCFGNVAIGDDTVYKPREYR